MISLKTSTGGIDRAAMHCEQDSAVPATPPSAPVEDAFEGAHRRRQASPSPSAELSRLLSPVLRASPPAMGMPPDDAELAQCVHKSILSDSAGAALDGGDVLGHDIAQRALYNVLDDLRDGVSPERWRSVLLHGPSGVGKTMLTHRMAMHGCQAAGSMRKPVTFIDVARHHVPRGCSFERYISAVFAVARQQQPAVILMDDADGLLRQGSHCLPAARHFLAEAAGLRNANVMLLLVTDTPWHLSDAVLKLPIPTTSIKLTPPDAAVRGAMLTQALTRLACPCEATEAELAALAASEVMEGMTGAHIATVAIRALEMGPQRRRHEARFFEERGGKLWPCDAQMPNAFAGTYLQLLLAAKAEGRSRLHFGREPITLDHLKQACALMPSGRGHQAMCAAFDLPTA